MADETISTRIVANADFSALIADVHKVTASLSKLQEQLASSNKMLANQIAQLERISNLSANEAREQLMDALKAEAESKRLQGQGIADQRHDQTRGLCGSKHSPGVDSQE